MNSRFFQSLFRLFQFAENGKCRRISLELISWGAHSSVEREKVIRRRLFTSSIKLAIRHFQMYKKAWCTCKVVVLRNKLIAFLTSSLPSPSSLLKLANYSTSARWPRVGKNHHLISNKREWKPNRKGKWPFNVNVSGIILSKAILVWDPDIWLRMMNLRLPASQTYKWFRGVLGIRGNKQHVNNP